MNLSRMVAGIFVLSLLLVSGMCGSAHAGTADEQERPRAVSGERRDGAKPRFVVGIPTDIPPIAFLNEQGTGLRGMAVDLAIMLAGRLKQEVRFLADTPESLERRLRAGSVDFVLGLPQPKTTPRDLEVLVTPFALNRRILVAAPEAHVTCEQDFRDRRILVLGADPYIDVIRKAGGTALPAETYQEALSRLSRGEADAFAAESGEIASYVAQRMGMNNVRLMGLPLERVPIVLEVKSGSEDLHSALTSTLVQLERDGHLDLLRDKWLGRSLTERNFWETYRHPILTVLGGAALMVLVVGIWIFTLRRQVRLTTRNLRSSEKRYRELIEGSPDMTVLLGPDGSIRLANRIARETLDISPESEQGSLALWEAMCDQGQDCLRLLLDDSSSTRRIREEITLHPDSPDKRKIMEFIAFPTGGDHRDESLICCIGRDMTERRRLEQELVEVERLAIIGKTAASVAHEINNPLGIIMANTDVALEELNEASPAIRRLLQAIQRNVERAAATTRRLLNIAMPPSINQEPQNLTDIVREALAFLRPRMKDVTVDVSRLQDSLPLTGDRILLEQLIINLLLNALESMEDRGSLTIIGERRPDGRKEEGPVLHLEIRDSGKGIPPENLEKIFDPFFTTRGSRGFGLGLFISRRIVEAHKGNLHAESEPGNGAGMILEFPPAP